MIHLDNELIDKELGKYGIYSAQADNTLINELKYIGGLEAIDQLIRGKHYAPKAGHVNLMMRPKGVELMLRQGFTKHSFGLMHQDINYWAIEKLADIIILKQDAILGKVSNNKLIRGGIGQDVADFLSDKDDSPFIEADVVITISFTNDLGSEQVFLLSCTRSGFEKVREYFQDNFVNKEKDAFS